MHGTWCSPARPRSLPASCAVTGRHPWSMVRNSTEQAALQLASAALDQVPLSYLRSCANAGWKFWVPASGVNFWLVPLRLQVGLILANHALLLFYRAPLGARATYNGVPCDRSCTCRPAACSGLATYRTHLTPDAPRVSGLTQFCPAAEASMGCTCNAIGILPDYMGCIWY